MYEDEDEDDDDDDDEFLNVFVVKFYPYEDHKGCISENLDSAQNKEKTYVILVYVLKSLIYCPLCFSKDEKSEKKTTCQKLVAMVSSNLMDKDLLLKNDSQMNCRKSDRVWLL